MEQLTTLAKQKIPFAFILSYDKKQLLVEPLDALTNISFEISKQTAYKNTPLQNTPLDFESYKKAYEKVIENIKEGNTYLLNLTGKSKLHTKHSLQTIYESVSAKYKVMLKDHFVCFSPETFVKIKDNTIYTYPMKGTISADIKDAKQKLLKDAKELAEHTMIVDLLRNDLGIIANSVKVDSFRYIEDIGGLLQASSQISAKVPNWQESLGQIIDAITPAGSISGTPKKKTCELIQQIEKTQRGFYTGIFGVYDGSSFDSCVLIRYIEQKDDALFYKSGGGITLDSDLQKEYQEMIEKIYLPLKEI